MIAAIGENRELGKDNKLLWNIPEDMRRFRNLTTGHVVVMGKNTFDSVGGRPLPNRTNVVLSHDVEYKPFGVTVVHSPQEAILFSKKKEPKEMFIIGGGMVYGEFFPYTDRLYLTVVHKKFEADTFFPDYSEFTKVLSKEERFNEEYKYTFYELERGEEYEQNPYL